MVDARLVARVVGVILVTGTLARADIHKWEWVDPADPAQGKQPSTIVCPGGFGVHAVPGADLSYQQIGSFQLPRDLEQAYLIGADLTGATLEGSRLSKADFHLATLTDAVFTDAVIAEVNLRGSTARGFTRSQLESTASYATRRDLSGIDLSHNTLDGWSFYWQDLAGVRLAGATIAGANFELTRHLTEAMIRETASYQNGRMAGVRLAQQDLSEWDLSAQHLADASFRHSNLQQANLSGAALANADLTFARIEGADLAATTAGGLSFAQIRRTRSWGANRSLRDVNLADNDLTNWDFEEIDLTDASFTGSRLEGAILRNARVKHVDFSETTGLTGAQFASTWNYQNRADFGALDLSGVDLGGFDLQYQDLSEADFDDAVINGANLANMILPFMALEGITADQLYATRSYRERDLTDVRLANNDLTGWDLSGQDLTGADLRSAELFEVDLSGATLTDARLENAALMGANLSGATGRGLTAEQFHATWPYRAPTAGGRLLRRCNLSHNDMAGWRFTGQDMTEAVLDGAAVTDATFVGADLTDASLRDADARGSDLTALQIARAADLTNFVHPDGGVEGLTVPAGQTVRLWDYDGRGELPIEVRQHLTIEPGGVLRLEIDDEAWGSRLVVPAGVAVDLAGTLELVIREPADPRMLSGTTFDLFDWPAPRTAAFDRIETHGVAWDLARLYTEGTVTLVPEPATLVVFLIAAAVAGGPRRRNAAGRRAARRAIPVCAGALMAATSASGLEPADLPQAGQTLVITQDETLHIPAGQAARLAGELIIRGDGVNQPTLQITNRGLFTFGHDAFSRGVIRSENARVSFVNEHTIDGTGMMLNSAGGGTLSFDNRHAVNVTAAEFGAVDAASNLDLVNHGSWLADTVAFEAADAGSLQLDNPAGTLDLGSVNVTNTAGTLAWENTAFARLTNLAAHTSSLGQTRIGNTGLVQIANANCNTYGGAFTVENDGVFGVNNLSVKDQKDTTTIRNRGELSLVNTTLVANGALGAIELLNRGALMMDNTVADANYGGRITFNLLKNIATTGTVSLDASGSSHGQASRIQINNESRWDVTGGLTASNHNAQIGVVNRGDAELAALTSTNTGWGETALQNEQDMHVEALTMNTYRATTHFANCGAFVFGEWAVKDQNDTTHIASTGSLEGGRWELLTNGAQGLINLQLMDPLTAAELVLRANYGGRININSLFADRIDLGRLVVDASGASHGQASQITISNGADLTLAALEFPYDRFEYEPADGGESWVFHLHGATDNRVEVWNAGDVTIPEPGLASYMLAITGALALARPKRRTHDRS